MKQIESLNSQHEYLANQLDSLKNAAEPSKAEIARLEELKKVISEEEKEINRLTKGSKQLKEKVGILIYIFFLFYYLILSIFYINIYLTV